MANYIEALRKMIRRELPSLDDELLEMYTLLGAIRGTEVSNSDVHEAWAVWQNRKRPDHKSLIPFGHLTPEVQDLDTPYRDAIIRAVQGVGR